MTDIAKFDPLANAMNDAPDKKDILVATRTEDFASGPSVTISTGWIEDGRVKVPWSPHSIPKEEFAGWWDIPSVTFGNATFYIFRETGKYYTEGRGTLPEDAFGPTLNHYERREPILAANGGKMPGLSSSGEGYVIMVVPDEDVSYGWPLMLPSRNDFLPHM